MSAPVLHTGASVRCAHGGQAVPTSAGTPVRVAGHPVVVLTESYLVTGCPLATPEPSPCVTARFVAGAIRLRVGGSPVVLASSTGVCDPNGSPVTVSGTQSRVTAS